MNETEWVVQIPDKEVEDRYMGGWMAGWTDRDSSIVQLELSLHQRSWENKYKCRCQGRQNAVVGLLSHKSRRC